MLFSVETQTTEERTQQYQSEVESIYKDLTAKGKALMLSTELGVRFVPTVNRKHFGFFFLVSFWHNLGIPCITDSRIMFNTMIYDLKWNH